MTRAILTDIEGTTTSISFVFDVLFPYARAHIGEFVHAQTDEPARAWVNRTPSAARRSMFGVGTVWSP